MGIIPLLHQRQALYSMTRPAYAFAAAGAGYCTTLGPPSPPARSAGGSTSAERASLLAMALAGGAGVVAVCQRRGGFAWLSHAYEAVAWGSAFAGVSGAAALAVAEVAADTRPLLSFSAGCALATTAGERLGSAVGRGLLGPLALGGVASALLAVNVGDPRYDETLQLIGLVLLPLLHLCPPVYTHSINGMLAFSWFGAAALATTIEDTVELADGLSISPSCLSHCLVTVGTLSLLRVKVIRRPICQY